MNFEARYIVVQVSFERKALLAKRLAHLLSSLEVISSISNWFGKIFFVILPIFSTSNYSYKR